MPSKKKSASKAPSSGAGPTHYKVISPWVKSEHKKGDVITRSQAQAGGADVNNLIYIGAIEATDAPTSAPSTNTNTNTSTGGQGSSSGASTGGGSSSSGSTGSASGGGA